MNINDLPSLNALLNFISSVLLITGFVFIKKGLRNRHKKTMLSAVCSSALFLISYLIYHNAVGSVPYPYHDWTRILYFVILIPHIILAGVMVPFILIALWLALRGTFEKHKKIARYVLPVWLFVSVSGLAVYFMLYIL
jgi:putative membrane protein